MIDVAPEMGRPVVADGTTDSLSPVAPWRTVNIARGVPVTLDRLVETIEAALGEKAVQTMLPVQPGDVTDTFADVALLRALIGRVPSTPIEDGVTKFVEWYRQWKD